MRRVLLACAAVGVLTVMLLPESVYAQRRGGGGRSGGERSGGGERGWSSGWGGERGWGGGDRGWGGYGWGNRGSYYGGRNYGGYYSDYGYPYDSYSSDYYGSQPYYSDYGSQPYYTYDQYSSPGANETYTDQGGMQNSRNTVAVRVILPDPNAQVSFEGQTTKQRGNDRLFVSPPVEPGKDYHYTIKATFNQNGQQVTRTKTVPVRAGQMAVADFVREGNRMQQGTRIRTGTESTEEFDSRSRTGRHEAEEGHLFTGKVVSINDDQVIVSDMQGANQHTFRIPASADVMVEGKKSSATGLKPGMHVTITPEANETGVASKIEAKTGAQDEGTPNRNLKNQGNLNQNNPPTRNPDTSRPPQR